MHTEYFCPVGDDLSTLTWLDTPTHMHAHTHMHTHTHTCTNTHTHMHTYTYTHTCMDTHTCTHACTYVHTHARMHACTYALLTLFNCVVCCWGNHSCCDFAESTTGTWSCVELSMSKSPQTCLYTFLPISCLLFCSMCVCVCVVCVWRLVRSVHHFLWITRIFYLFCVLLF